MLWGPLAPLVLKRWRITRTIDFGNIVFALIRHRVMQKQPQDRLSDFSRVYDFREAFDFVPQLGDERPSPP